MKVIAKHLSSVIRNRRRELNLSQEDVSRVMGWNKTRGQFLSNIERSKCTLPAKYISKISETIQLPPEAIIDAMLNDYREALSREVHGA